MKFKIRKTDYQEIKSKFNMEVVKQNSCIDVNTYFIEINTLEELLELRIEQGTSLIVDRDTIEIYNDYRE